MLCLGFYEPNVNVLNETHGDWSMAGEKWLLAAHADKIIGFQPTKSQGRKEKETIVPNGGRRCQNSEG